jgi:hypothetical protein
MRIPLVTRAVLRIQLAFMLQWHKARNKRASASGAQGGVTLDHPKRPSQKCEDRLYSY